MIESTSISSKAILYGITLGSESFVRQDKKISREVEIQHNAKQGSGAYRKYLIDQDTPILKKIRSKDTEIRAYFHRNTLPWLDDGARMLAISAYLEFSKDMGKLIREREALVPELLAEYPALKQAAAVQLNGMFNEKDYPTEAELQRKFYCRVRVLPFPKSGDVRLDVGAEELARVQAETEKGIQDAVTSALLEIMKRMKVCVDAMQEKLAAYSVDAKGAVSHPFRDSVVGNLREMVMDVPKLNITNDHRITQMAEAIEKSLLRYSAQELRDDFMARNEAIVASTALSEALAKADAIMGVV